MIISSSRKFVFVHIPKCAGTSMSRALARTLAYNDVVLLGPEVSTPSGKLMRDGLGLSKHSSAAEIMALLGAELWQSLFTFSFVREPADRLLSLYRYGRRQANRYPLSEEEAIAYRDTGALPDRGPYAHDIMRQCLQNDSFSDYVLAVIGSDHWALRPQAATLSDDAGNLLVDHVGKIETIEDDWAVIQQRLQLDIALPRVNESGVAVDSTLAPEAAAAIRERYAIDYERFGYRPSF